MAILSATDLNFTYADADVEALKDISFNVQKGEFILLCGKSGSGKSTLLRLLKQEVAPYGIKQGKIMYKGTALEKRNPLEMAKEIGMVFQDPENQIVMDTVMEELLFGLENVGFTTAEMRKKVAEMVHFFGLNHLLKKKTHELSGGQKQLINLASVLLLDPKILLLDEPTAQLDPIAAKEFIHTLHRLNEEIGLTIIIVEHRFEELFAIANRIMMLEDGEMVYLEKPCELVQQLVTHGEKEQFLPFPSLLYLNYDCSPKHKKIPLTVREAKQWLDDHVITSNTSDSSVNLNEPILEFKEIDYQYTKQSLPVLQNLSLTVHEGEWLAILGANGTGKTTLLKIMASILKAHHGVIKYKGKKVKNVDSALVGYLPQNPKVYFLKDSIMEEYIRIANYHDISNAGDKIRELLKKFNITHLENRHPYDLSGGELQRAALIGTLLVNPSILLIDEPTKGLDPESKEDLGKVLIQLVNDGLTIIMVSHDVEFVAKYATRCSMLFQGEITVTEATKDFFKENAYYTTVMNRITRNSHVPPVITLEEAKQTWHVQSGS